MREILFRAKEENTGEWVYGYYTLYPKCCGLHPCILTGTESGCIIPKFIDLNTLGIYTNMLDKNGKKIFEGDIVRNKNKYFQFVGIVKYQNGQFLVDWKLHQRMSEKVISSTVTHHLGNADEVIGNIFDNQKLLKEGE